LEAQFDPQSIRYQFLLSNVVLPVVDFVTLIREFGCMTDDTIYTYLFSRKMDSLNFTYLSEHSV
jgi:hypothetical protein